MELLGLDEDGWDLISPLEPEDHGYEMDRLLSAFYDSMSSDSEVKLSSSSHSDPEDREGELRTEGSVCSEADRSNRAHQSPDTHENDEEEPDERLPLRTCAAAAAELVTCVLRSGGWPGACSESRLRGCLVRTGHARPGERATPVRTRHGRAVAVHADAFESLALMIYGEWMEWALGVLEK